MRALFFASFLMLFGETMAIRWLGVEIPVFRAFPNLVLMVVFIGASAGIAKPEKHRPRALVVAAVAVLMASVMLVPISPLKDMSLRLDAANSLTTVLVSIASITLNALSLMVVFHEIGTTVGEGFQKLDPLKAYSINILGSMLGVLAFAISSFLSGPPWLWLIVCMAASLAYLKSRWLVALMAPVVILSFFATHNSHWSPYGKLDIHNFEMPAGSVYGQGNYMLFCNNVYFHMATHAPAESEFERVREEGKKDRKQGLLFLDYVWMEIPYMFARKADDVLILGAGSGNDVAFGLRKPVKHFDAVEIDPVIGTFGSTVHPDKPYNSPRVNLIINDARSYLRETKTKYDLIDFSCLDPGGTLNTASFLRVDNFVYTTQCIKDTLACLKADGVVAMSFATGPDHPITARLYNTIKEATGKGPVSMCDNVYGSCIFLFGPGIDNHLAEAAAAVAKVTGIDSNFKPWQPTAEQSTIRSCDDDWPFLYLQFDRSGLVIYSLVLLLTVLAPVLVTLRGGKDMLKEPEAFALFFLGEAFMLIETKSCTELSLIWGNTWLVSSIVIFTVLALGFLANAYVIKKPSGTLLPLYAGITISLVANYFIHTLTGIPDKTFAIMVTVIACLPALFGGILFSRLLNRAAHPNLCFAANLLGVTFGGLLENFCVVGGIKSLSLVALMLYLCSILPIWLKVRKDKNQA